MSTTTDFGNDESTSSIIESQIKSLRRRMALTPLLTCLFSTLLSLVVSHTVLNFPGRETQSDSLRQFLKNYQLWFGAPQVTEGNEFDITAILLALGALTLAIFLQLNATDGGDEAAAPTAIQAQRIVLNELSIVTAFTTAILAWLTIPLVGFQIASIPAIILATAIAVLCSAVLPLHRDRATSLRISLKDAQSQCERMSISRSRLESSHAPRITSHFRRRKFWGVLLWVFVVSAINAIMGAIFNFLTTDDRGWLSHFSFGTGFFLITALWSVLTIYFLGEAFIAKARDNKFLSGKFNYIIYTVLTAMIALSFWLELASQKHWVVSAIFVVLACILIGVFWWLDRHKLHLLDRHLLWRLDKETKASKQRIIMLERRLDNATVRSVDPAAGEAQQPARSQSQPPWAQSL